MKTLFTMLLLIFGMSAATYAQPAPSPCNEGRARGAAHADAVFQQCIVDWQTQNGFWDIDIVVSATPGKDGCLYTVEAWACPACHGPQPCPKIACRAVATATIDVNFNVTSVTCL